MHSTVWSDADRAVAFVMWLINGKRIHRRFVANKTGKSRCSGIIWMFFWFLAIFSEAGTQYLWSNIVGQPRTISWENITGSPPPSEQNLWLIPFQKTLNNNCWLGNIRKRHQQLLHAASSIAREWLVMALTPSPPPNPSPLSIPSPSNSPTLGVVRPLEAPLELRCSLMW